MSSSKRPGRKLGAEKRRIAREIIRDFISSEDWKNLDRKVQLAILQLAPSIKEVNCDG